MQVTDVKNPGERNKLIGAGVLGIIAIILLWWTFFGFGGNSSKPAPRQPSGPTASSVRPTAAQTSAGPQSVVEMQGDLLNQLTPIPVVHVNLAGSVPAPRRNIFAFAEPSPRPVISSTPTPTPTPTPPVLLAAIAPQMVYARTGDFTLEVTGDKFVPGIRILVDDNELQTRYTSPQQLSATVPASMIANPGSRQVMVRSNDGKIYSNLTTLNISAPPTPNYSYIGIIGTPRFIDTAILQDKSSKDILNIQKGDLLAGKFRVTSISEKEVVVVDTNLKIKHTVPFSVQGERSGLQGRPTPRVESEDDEP
jgi:hypothetical protein